MFNHVSEGYKCPICLGVKGIENGDTMLKRADLVYQDVSVSVFINSFWIATTEAHVIVVPNEHFENIYDIPKELGLQLFEVTKKMSIVIKKAYQCDGITIRQNNEPAGNQHALHFHQHVFPRYTNDSFNINLTKKSLVTEPKDRIKYVKLLQKYL